MSASGLSVQPLTGALGVAVFRLPLQSMGPNDLDALLHLVERHGVVILPDQHITTDEHVALAHELGTPQVHRYHASTGPFPEVLRMRSDRAVADFWHADETFEETPPDLAVLRMVECPPVGGDTIWVNQCLALGTLPEEIQSRLTDLRAVHVTPDGDVSAIHPMSSLHPITGRRALFVNPQFTRSVVGMSQEDSNALLKVLFATSDNPDLQCRWRWHPGDVAIWDNRTTMHRVVADYDRIRHAERIGIVTDRPFATE